MILGIDCSQGLSFIFFDKKKIFYQYKNHKINNVSEVLVSIIENSLKKINKKYEQINKIIIINGPGSFTGIRCSVTFAKMIRSTLSIPIYGFSKFELANFQYTKNDKNKDFKKRIFLHYQGKNFFHASFDKKIMISGPEILNIGQFNFNHYQKDLIICDSKVILDSLIKDKKIKNLSSVSIFNYKFEDIVELKEQSFQKKYIPQPIYVKNFY